MFFLRSTKDDTTYHIRKSITTIGRQIGDIILKDNGVSRKHAELLLEGGKLYLISLKEQLRTSINNIAVMHKIRNSLEVGDIVKFGMSFEFKVDNLSFRVATSSLPEPQKIELENYLKEIDTKLSNSFRPDCTHLVVSELCPSIKVICAVILNIPIVTVEFFKQLRDASKNFPAENDFRPRIKPSIHEVQESFFLFNNKRKTLFKGKTFVFVDERSGKPMKTMISLAGGEYSPFDPLLVSEYRRTTIPAKYVIIHCESPETLPIAKGVKTAYIEVCAALAACQWRSVPMQEIAFALLKCNCDMDCNPAFSKGKKLLRVINSEDSPNKQAPLAHSTERIDSVLAPATQTQAFITSADIITANDIIPPSLDDFEVSLPSTSKSVASSQALARRNRTEISQNKDKTLEKRYKTKDNAKMVDLSKSDSGGKTNPFEEVSKPITESKGVYSIFTPRQKTGGLRNTPLLISSEQSSGNTDEMNSSVLTVVKRKSGGRSVATLENPVTKKVAREDVVLSGGDNGNSVEWISKLTPSQSQNKRKFEGDMSQILNDDADLSQPIKIEPFEPIAKKQKSFTLVAKSKSKNAFKIGNTEDITAANKDDLQSLTQTMTSYFEARVKYEDVTDGNATLDWAWTSCRSRRELESEDIIENDCLMKDYAEKYFCNFEEKLKHLNLSGNCLEKCNAGGANYKKFQKTQHIPIHLKGDFI